MADLKSLYQEFGLTGIIPYALIPNSPGRQMLVNKLKKGDPLFILFSALDTPFLLIKNEDYHVYAYTNFDLAEKAALSFKNENYLTHPVPVPADPEERALFFQSLYFNGASQLFFDEALSVPISLFTTLPTYDGYLSNDFPLWNHALNAAINYALQIEASGYTNAEAWKQFALRMKDGHFLIVSNNNKQAQFPLMTIQNGKRKCFLVYTDWLIIQKETDAQRLLGCIISFSELETLLQSNPGYDLILNRPTCCHLLNKESFQIIHDLCAGRITEQMQMKTSAGHNREEDLDDDNPVPEWLR